MSRVVVDMAPPTAADLAELAGSLRDEDVQELHAAGYDDLPGLLAASVALSSWVRAVRVNGELACVLGLVLRGTALTPMGVPWMLGTVIVKRQRRILVRLGHEVVNRMLDTAPYLLNTVHADNGVAIRWLQRMGFALGEPYPTGPYGALFRLFELRRGAPHV
jgi:hypothetical protein